MLPMPLMLLVLLAIWAALLFGGYAFGGGSDRRMPRWTRLGSSLVLVVAGWAFVLITPQGPLATFAFLIAVGMTLGFTGDLFMARVFPVPNHFIGGIAAFGLGHIAYIAAGLGLGNALGVSPGVRLAAWLAWLLFGALGWYVIVFRGPGHTPLEWAALPYALLLSSTAGVATGLALQDARLIPFAVGAALFLFSDLMIAATTFTGRPVTAPRSRRVSIDDLIWLTYGPGQCLIVYTTAFLLLIPG